MSGLRPGTDDQSYLDWLKQSPRSRRGQGLSGAFERIYFLQDLQVEQVMLPPLPLSVIKAYANRMARLKLTRFNRLRAESQTVGLSCFMHMTLSRVTDETVKAWLVRVSEARRLALERGARVNASDWQQRHTH